MSRFFLQCAQAFVRACAVVAYGMLPPHVPPSVVEALERCFLDRR
jgi:hypothetical protein